MGLARLNRSFKIVKRTDAKIRSIGTHDSRKQIPDRFWSIQGFRILKDSGE